MSLPQSISIFGLPQNGRFGALEAVLGPDPLISYKNEKLKGEKTSDDRIVESAMQMVLFF